jgi:hypothetical protein
MSTSALDRSTRYLAYLIDEGYRPQMDDPHCIIFRREGRGFVLICEDSDAEFFHLLYPRFWLVHTSEQHSRALLAANRTTKGLKAVKVFVGDDNRVYASIEAFYPGPDDFAAVFARNIRALVGAAATFIHEMEDDVQPEL